MKLKKILLFLFPIMGVTLTACYGVPYTGYRVKVLGKVMDEENQPINNIKIEVGTPPYYYDKCYSDMEGNYQLHGELDFNEIKTLNIMVTDIDGEENGGEYESAMIELACEKEEWTDKRNDEDYGILTKEINFTLKKK